MVTKQPSNCEFAPHIDLCNKEKYDGHADSNSFPCNHNFLSELMNQNSDDIF